MCLYISVYMFIIFLLLATADKTKTNVLITDQHFKLVALIIHLAFEMYSNGFMQTSGVDSLMLTALASCAYH